MDSYSKKTKSEEIFSLNRKSSLPISETKSQNAFYPKNKEAKSNYRFVVDWQLP